MISTTSELIAVEAPPSASPGTIYSALHPLASQAPPPLVYHYTDRRGLIGIMQSRAVWATHVRYLNDSSEYAYTTKYAEALAPHLAQEIHDKPVRDAFEDFVSWLLAMEVNTNCFVFSLSADGGDRLSQWRGYGRPSDAYSLGFESPRLVELATKIGGYFIPCIYDRALQDRLLRKFLAGCIDDLRTALLTGDPDQVLQARTFSLINFDFLATYLKDPTFQEEQEWRIVLPSRTPAVGGTQYRAGRSLLTPYVVVPIELTDGSIPVRQVIIGPAPHTPLDAAAVIQLSRDCGFSLREVPYSTVPYRSW